jgi:alpha-L-rhamnosidase
MKTKILTTLILLAWLPGFSQPHSLRCEYLTNPLGIDVVKPRLSWILPLTTRGEVQTAYHITVSSAPGGGGDLWNSGKVASSQSTHVEYNGSALTSEQACYWKVETFGIGGASHGSSEEAFWTMGLLAPGDWQGEWIRTTQDISAPLLRKEFDASKEIKRATIYASGIGWHELYINGEKVGDHVLSPITSYYDNDQPFAFGSRVIYETHDVTEYLKTGGNAIGVWLGNGWYSNDGNIQRYQVPFSDRPQLIFQMNIEFTDGTSAGIVSDGTWKSSAGPITQNAICEGESYDARLEKTGWNNTGFNDAGWNAVVIANAPSGKLVAQMMPAVKVIDSIAPLAITQPAAGVYVYDFGQHFTGWTKLRVSGSSGDRVTMAYASALNGNGRLELRHQWGLEMTDSYTLKGAGMEVWEPRFTLHGFRYVELTGFPGTPTLESLQGYVVHNAVETSGSFESSNPLLNQIHHNVRWTFKSLLQGIPQDAADRCERCGWLGDPSGVIEDVMINFNTASFWAKWLDDIKDSQKPNGDIPVISPMHMRDRFDMWPNWKSTYALVAWYLYEFYGDEKVLADHYDGIEKLVEFLGTWANGHIIQEGLGDHMEADRLSGVSNFLPVRTPVDVTSTAVYYYDAWILAQAAQILGKTNDYNTYSNLANQIKDAFNNEFFNPQTNQYSTGSQTSNSMSLQYGLVPEGMEGVVLDNLVDDIMNENEGHLSTGIIGTNALEQVLGKSGRADVMYAIATKTTFPSWGYSISLGATTVWENWGGVGDRSLNMKMLGSTEIFFISDLAGIKKPDYTLPGEMTPAFKKNIIRPYIPDDLTYAKASYKSLYGTIVSDWKKEDNGVFTFSVTVPPNTTADIHVPKINYNTTDWAIQEKQGVCWQSGAWVPNTPGITLGMEQGEYIVFQAGSGEYRFQAGPHALVSVAPPGLSLSLTRNFPNPFTSATTITYRVSGEGKANVTLKIFDMNGALVKELVNRPHTPGSYTAHWDGNDFRGSAASQGAYIYRLEAGEGMEVVSKMLKM